ncbi:MAG TPA: efflux RND transporter periplasmic adaptor subunit [Rhodocyclaceae bacterium]|uniref:efflux RND transporter periplasmic adaptor subunit n=1 Tax=Zoogloea sp. TaxID=49181 RepID=UPI002BEC33AB|nr:efflux RND transporter periplasmic adaptor subunit [Zoogloea sp.]HMZ77886.1 efflux RND transporter periplasmic adaptor subunit [Rhodocyclaceae bacterium]HNH15880.1 efflux RND transporter periplasmic adaptor subunit [Zoogloea sp.]
MNLPSSFKTATVPAVLLGLFLTACQDARPPAAPAAAARPSPSSALGEVPGSDTDAPPADPHVVAVPPRFGVALQVLPVASAALSDTLRVAGKVDFDERRVSRIGATVTGRVVEIQAHLGQTVHAGDTLAIINSTELGQAQIVYLKARAQADLQSRSVERARQLFAADVIGRAELQRRESELAIATAEQRGAEDQLQVLGMSAGAIRRLGAHGAINSVTPVVSATAGTVVERKVTQGQVVQPSDSLFMVADLSQVWVTAEVPEQQAALVKSGQSVEIEVPALGARLTGKLIYVADTVNPDTRTVTVRSAVDNRARQLKPAMLATMLIQAAPAERLVVPAQAVVRDANTDNVFVEIAPQRFRLTPVRLGPEADGRRAVLEGLKAEQRILVAGAFHLNNERKRKELE